MENKEYAMILPCKVGDTVWTIHHGKQAVYKHTVDKYVIKGESGNKNFMITVYKGMAGMETYRKWRLNQLGKFVFLTREEAEQALGVDNEL